MFSRLDNTHPAYRILRPGAKQEDIERFLEEAKLATEPWEKADISSLLEVSVRANKELYRKMKEENVMGEAIQELFQEDIDKIVNADKDKLEKKGADMLADLLKQLDPASQDFQTALNGTSEDRKKLYVQYKIVYEEVGEDTEAAKDSEENNKKDSTES